MKRILTLAAMFAIGAAALTPLASHAQGAYAQVQYGYDHDPRYAVPAERYARVPHPRRGYVWQPGHWERHGHRHVWIDGQWLRARPGYGGHYGGQRMRHGRDLDRDGIPDGRDRDRDNDGVPNWHDRDRDGDGVRNEYDRRPDNPYR